MAKRRAAREVASSAAASRLNVTVNAAFGGGLARRCSPLSLACASPEPVPLRRLRNRVPSLRR